MFRDSFARDPVLMWYGKIPGMGDFVRRRMPDQVLLPWERWFSNGINQARSASRAVGQPLLGGAAAPMTAWGFVMSLPQGGVQAGAVVPSQDRVGREYPVCALALLDPEQCRRVRLPALAGGVEQLGLALAQGVRFCWAATQLDQTLCRAASLERWLADSTACEQTQHDAGRDILDVLYGPQSESPQHDPWAVLQPCLEPGVHRSYWWRLGMSNPVGHSVTHSGELTWALFRRLFVPAGATDADGRLF